MRADEQKDWSIFQDFMETTGRYFSNAVLDAAIKALKDEQVSRYEPVPPTSALGCIAEAGRLMEEFHAESQEWTKRMKLREKKLDDLLAERSPF